MNYLAHAYLSFNQPDILVGNMISDYIKGKKQFDYPVSVQKGIQLHRKIDEFTDFHPVTQEAKSFFKQAYRLYAGAFVDIVYDHFLANDPQQFNDEESLLLFCTKTYTVLENNYTILPQKFQQMLPYMQSQNWLFNYRHKPGIEKSFGGLVRRAAYLNESTTAFEIFTTNYEALKICYKDFFPELKEFTLNQLAAINNS